MDSHATKRGCGLAWVLGKRHWIAGTWARAWAFLGYEEETETSISFLRLRDAKILFNVRAFCHLASRTFSLRLLLLLPTHTFSFYRYSRSPLRKTPRIVLLKKTCIDLSPKNVAARGTSATGSQHSRYAICIRRPSAGHCRCAPPTLKAARPPITCSSTSAPNWLGFGVATAGTKSHHRYSWRRPPPITCSSTAAGTKSHHVDYHNSDGSIMSNVLAKGHEACT
jgi:hypothetical protein